MNKKRFLPYLLILLLNIGLSPCLSKAWGQEQKLKEVKVKRYRKRSTGQEGLKHFAPGMQIQELDSSTLAQYKLEQLDRLLTQQAPVFVKSYGINSLATLNFRGSSSAQTQIFWNGVPLNNASSGLTDISLLNVHHFEKVQLAYGSSSALAGSGNVGAAILLDNDFDGIQGKTFNTNIAFSIGSFHHNKLAIKECYQDSQTFVSASFLVQNAQNNFHYENAQGQSQTMSNASFKSYSGLLFAKRQLNAQSDLKIAYWQQQFNREIPPALFEPLSLKLQNDFARRVFLAYENDFKSELHFYLKTAFSSEKMQFSDPTSQINTHNNTQTFFAEAGLRKQTKKGHEYLLFMPISRSWIAHKGDSLYQNRFALGAAYLFRYWGGKMEIAVNGRLEQINQQTITLGGINGAVQIHPYLKLRANVQSTYRAPSLNEWYYEPGGNPDLKPEKGWAADAGYLLKFPISRHVSIQHELSGFQRHIKDWILWFGGSIWTPHNIARVWSRGIESFNTCSIDLNAKLQLQLGLNTSYVIATTQDTYVSNDGSIGKQIPYSPRYNGQGNIGLASSKWKVSINQTYTGYRFTTVDESEYIEPYSTTNVYGEYQIRLSKRSKLILGIQCNNLLNQQYQVVKFRPMPGINCSVNAKIIL